MAERHMNVIELKGFSADVMEILLKSIYGESVTVNSDNVQDILPAASLLQLNATGRLTTCTCGCSLVDRLVFSCFTDIQRRCALFLASHLEPANCLGIYCFADLHNCSQLKQAGETHDRHNNEHAVCCSSRAALSFIWTHFAAVVHSDEFLTLKANEVEDLIQSDEIEVNTIAAV
jgi:hypothetical protein